MASEALKIAMAELTASGDAPALAPSKLGTKDHWDSVYEREVKMFKECGDEGEVWFGEDSAEQMVEWLLENLPLKSSKILDLGCGNGHLLQLLNLAGYTNLTGLDYSPASIELAKNISKARSVSSITFAISDILNELPSTEEDKYDIVLDKGTYDAISLSDEINHLNGKKLVENFPLASRGWLRNGGTFFITSCNFTRPELEKSFINEETGYKYLDHIPRPTFSFGGATGQTITSIAFST